MAVLEGPDFKISRGSMPPEPPRGSRLPALGPLFTNFLDPPLVSVRISLRQTLQGEQYQFIEATQYHYLPTITSPSHTENFETQDRAKVKGSC